MSDSGEAATGELARFVGSLVLVAAALAALGYLPTRALGGEGAVPAMVAAIGVTLLGSVVGAYPVFVARLREGAKPQVVMISMLVRLAAVAVLATVVWLGLELPATPFLLWLALSYLLLLVIDTRYATRALAGP